MFFYPIHQAVSQLQQTFMLATGATSAYSLIGIGTMLISIPIAYAVLASPVAHPPGLGLGAVGLAAKMVLLQLLGVTVQFWFLRRAHGFGWPIAYDVVMLGALVLASLAAKALVEWVVNVTGGGAHALPVAVGGAMLYAAAVGVVLTRWPDLAGVTPEQRDAAWKAMRRAVGAEAG
jgi:hypothetical protein